MPTFRGNKNVLLQPEGAEKPVVQAAYDHASRDYVVTLSAAEAKKHRAALLREGLHEVEDAPAADAEEVAD